MAKKEKEKSSKLSGILIFLLVFALIVFMKATFVLLLLGMLPSVVAYFADTTHDKMAVSTITCCNLSGTLPYVIELAQTGGEWSFLSYYLANGIAWMTMYGMAALGYLLVRVCPLAYNSILLVINSSMAFQIQQKQDALVKEWGEDVTRELT